MPKGLALAAAQSLPVSGDVRANVEHHLELMELAAAARARVLLFPELSLTGYELGRASTLAVTATDPRLQPLVDAAGEHQLTLIVGAPLRVGAALYNATLVLTPEGAVHWYAKHHLGAFPPEALSDARDGQLPPSEASVFSAGLGPCDLELCGQRLALAICSDANHPAHAKAAADRGASVYLASSFVIPSEYADASHNLQTRASEHGLCVVFANFGRESGGMASAGRSAIWSATGQLLAQLGPTGSGIVVAIEEESGWRASATLASP